MVLQQDHLKENCFCGLLLYLLHVNQVRRPCLLLHTDIIQVTFQEEFMCQLLDISQPDQSIWALADRHDVHVMCLTLNLTLSF